MKGMATSRALIVGGSVSGLFAALRLLRDGWDVEVFERSEVELTGRGAGIVTQPQLREALEKVGVEAPHQFGVDVDIRRAFDSLGNVIAERRRPQITTSWNNLFEMLRRAFPRERYHSGKRLVDVIQHDSSVCAIFSDSSRQSADVLIGADGFRSRVRDLYAGQVRPAYAGYVAWRGLVDEFSMSLETRRAIFPYFAFGLAQNEQLLGYPIAGRDHHAQRGERRYNFVWYRPADEAGELRRLLTDSCGRVHRVAIPPPLIAKEHVVDLRERASALFAPALSEAVRLTQQPFLQPIYDLQSDRMAFGRVALIGDAAFVARPHVAAGTTKAAEDALALARSLAEAPDVRTALQRFEIERMTIGRRIVEQGRRLGEYIALAQSGADRDRGDPVSSPEDVLRETAVLDFLDGSP